MKAGLINYNKKYYFRDYIVGSLLQNNEYSQIFSFILNIFSEIQILGLTYWIAMNSSTESISFQGLSHTLNKIAKAITFDYFSSNSGNDLEKFAWIGIILLFLLITDLAMIISYITKKNIGFIRKAWSLLMTFHYSTYFLMIYRLSIETLNLNFQQEAATFNSYVNLSIVYIIISIPHAYLASWKCVYPLDSEKNVGFRKNGLMMTGLTLKIIIIPVLTLLQGSTMRWIKSILILILIFFRNLNLLYEIPIMNLRVFGVYLIFGIMQLCSSLIGVFILIFHSLGDYFCHIYFIISILSCWIGIHSLKLLIKRFAFYNIKEMKKEDHLFAKIASVKYIFSKFSGNTDIENSGTDSEYKVLYYSIIKQHNSSCKDIECGCKIVLEQDIQKESQNISNAEKKEKISELNQWIFKEIYREGIKQIKNNFMIKMNLAYLIANGKNKDVILPLLTIYSQKLDKLTLNQKFTLRKLIKLLEEQVNSNYSSKFFVNIESFYEYECLKNQFRDKIDKNLDSYINLWQVYISEMFGIASMLRRAEQINNETIQINKLWVEMRKKNESSSTEALEYSAYISAIANAPYSARKIERQFYKKVLMLNSFKDIEEINADNVDLKNDAFVYFSLKTGKIEHVSFTIDFLGYKTAEVVGKNIRDFMIHSLIKEFETIIADPSSLDESKFLHSTKSVCLINKEKYISNAQAYLAPIPNFSHDILMVCILREYQYAENLLVINDKGMIEGYSKPFGDDMTIDPKVHTKLKISDICMNYEKINDKSTLMLQSMKFNDISRSSEKLLTLETDIRKKTRLIKMLKNIKDYQNGDSKNELSLSFKPYKSLGSYKEYSTSVRKLSESVFCLELVKEEDSLEFEETAKEYETDNSIDKLFEDLDQDDDLDIGKTCYTGQIKDQAFAQSRGSFDRNKSRSRIIRTGIRNLTSDDEKKKSKLSQKDLKQKKILDFMDSNSVTSKMDSIGKEERYFKLLEEAIYRKKSIMSLKALNFLIILHTTLSIILLILYIRNSNNISDSIPDIVDMIKYNQQKVYWTYDNYWNGWLETSISKGFLEEGFGYTAQEYYDWLMTYYLTDGQIMLEQNNLIRKNLHNFNSKIQTYLNEPFPYTDKFTNETRYGDFFQVEMELGNSALSFYAEYSTKSYYPPPDHPDLEFIRKNSLNGLLIKSEKFFDLLAEEGNIRMNFLDIYLSIITGVIFGLSLAIYVSIFISEFLYRKEKSLFIDSFLQIRHEQAMEALKLAQNMKIFIAKEGNKTHTPINFYNHLAKKKHSVHQIKKAAVNYSGLYTRSYFFLLILFLFQLAIGGILLAINNIFQEQKDQTLLQLAQITETNKILFKFSSTFLTLYEYINTDGKSLIRYKPLKEEWLKDYDVLVSSYRFFFDITAQDPDIMAKITFILNGDLCKETFVNDDCSYDIPRQGVLAINSYVLSAIKQIKEVYDGSNRSEEAKNQALNLEQFRKAENVYFFNAIVGYSMIQDLLLQDISLYLNSLKKQTVKIISIFCVLMVLFTRLFWYPIWQRFVKERNAFGRVMRIIPFSIILNNGYLKAYLLSYANSILSSIKHTL